MSTVFVYGTLKRGFGNAHLLKDERFLGSARTAPCYRMFDCGGYPGVVEAGGDAGKEGVSIGGEIWEVSDVCLARLDRLEGLVHGYYRRGPVVLAPGFGGHGVVEAYFWERGTAGLWEVKSGEWGRHEES